MSVVIVSACACSQVFYGFTDTAILIYPTTSQSRIVKAMGGWSNRWPCGDLTVAIVAEMTEWVTAPVVTLTHDTMQHWHRYLPGCAVSVPVCIWGRLDQGCYVYTVLGQLVCATTYTCVACVPQGALPTHAAVETRITTLWTYSPLHYEPTIHFIIYFHETTLLDVLILYVGRKHLPK